MLSIVECHDPVAVTVIVPETLCVTGKLLTVTLPVMVSPMLPVIGSPSVSTSVVSVLDSGMIRYDPTLSGEFRDLNSTDVRAEDDVDLTRPRV